jgi:hypothetical protein
MRAIHITPENAKALRELFRQSIETYGAFDNLQNLLKGRILDIAGPMRWGEVAALCKGSDRFEVVTHEEYLGDTKKILWY